MSPSSEASELVTLADPMSGVRVRLAKPVDWLLLDGEPADRDPAERMLVLGVLVDPGGDALCQLATRPAAPTEQVAEVLRDLARRDGRPGPISPTRIGSLAGATCDVVRIGDRRPIRTRHAVAEDGGHLLWWTATAPGVRFAGFEARFDAICASIAFDEPRGPTISLGLVAADAESTSPAMAGGTASHLGLLAQLHGVRMQQLLERGDRDGAVAAFRRSVHWMHAVTAVPERHDSTPRTHDADPCTVAPPTAGGGQLGRAGGDGPIVSHWLSGAARRHRDGLVALLGFDPDRPTVDS